MKKKIVLLAILSILFLLSSCIIYHNVGWYKGDALDYIKANYTHSDFEVIDGEYLVSGEDEQGGFMIYEVLLENDEKRLIRMEVVFRKHLTQIGPEYKIKGIKTLSDEYEISHTK